jgi:hypothetical protein
LSDQQLAMVVRNESVQAWMTKVSVPRGAGNVSVTLNDESVGKLRLKVPSFACTVQVAESGMRMESMAHRPETTSVALVEDVVSQESRPTPSRARMDEAAGNLARGRKGKAHLVAAVGWRGIDGTA